MKINVDLRHMVAKMLMTSLALSMALFARMTTANQEYAVGKFPFLMPNVHPYRVCSQIIYTFRKFYNFIYYVCYRDVYVKQIMPPLYQLVYNE